MLEAAKAIYQDIMRSLKTQIINGDYLPGQKLPTEYSLAKAFNCSRITSKKALDELANEGLIVRVKGSGSYIAERVNPIAPEKNKNHFESKSNSESKNISMILPPGFLAGNLMEYFYGAAAVLSERGYMLHIASVDPCDNATDSDLIQQTIKNECAGIIYYPLFNTKETELLTVLSMNAFPIVTIDKYIEDLPISSVVSDNYGGAYAVTQILLEKGHRQIAFVSNTDISSMNSVKMRFLGYATALKDHGILLKTDNIINNYSQTLMKEHPEIYKQLYQILPLQADQYGFFVDMIDRLRKGGVSAIVCANDIVAMYMMKACEHMGISVPGDMAVMGFDDHIVLRQVGLSVTTVRQDFHAIGYRAAELLLEKIDDRGAPCKNIVLPVEVIERASS